ncbi:UPF0561 protein C2orf68 homolog isoform X2 [Apodemus sylvaticus]|uniref:UPF0561 protein C2orf68 homolog isoform X2 n=1 Tax=Apodemus sylvaticus TaxID=10129 RepID=UPI002243FABB|nr:UPF0561 protein C2orf68 homolog isoform X2 [Apodemus sylvaticus]
MEAARDPGPGLCCKPGGRLDMSHGFVHHIRRNQIARDDYDKKVKQAAKEKARRRHTPAPTRPRKPDLQVYLPRHRGEQPPLAAPPLGKPLFFTSGLLLTRPTRKPLRQRQRPQFSSPGPVTPVKLHCYIRWLHPPSEPRL